jgi:hypothetical protein
LSSPTTRCNDLLRPGRLCVSHDVDRAWHTLDRLCRTISVVDFALWSVSHTPARFCHCSLLTDACCAHNTHVRAGFSLRCASLTLWEARCSASTTFKPLGKISFPTSTSGRRCQGSFARARSSRGCTPRSFGVASAAGAAGTNDSNDLVTNANVWWNCARSQGVASANVPHEHRCSVRAKRLVVLFSYFTCTSLVHRVLLVAHQRTHAHVNGYLARHGYWCYGSGGVK